jgi:hypothetical protein
MRMFDIIGIALIEMSAGAWLAWTFLKPSHDKLVWLVAQLYRENDFYHDEIERLKEPPIMMARTMTIEEKEAVSKAFKEWSPKIWTFKSDDTFTTGFVRKGQLHVHDGAIAKAKADKREIDDVVFYVRALFHIKTNHLNFDSVKSYFKFVPDVVAADPWLTHEELLHAEAVAMGQRPSDMEAMYAAGNEPSPLASLVKAEMGGPITPYMDMGGPTPDYGTPKYASPLFDGFPPNEHPMEDWNDPLAELDAMTKLPKLKTRRKKHADTHSERDNAVEEVGTSSGRTKSRSWPKTAV